MSILDSNIVDHANQVASDMINLSEVFSSVIEKYIASEDHVFRSMSVTQEKSNTDQFKIYKIWIGTKETFDPLSIIESICNSLKTNEIIQRLKLDDKIHSDNWNNGVEEYMIGINDNISFRFAREPRPCLSNGTDFLYDLTIVLNFKYDVNNIIAKKIL